VAGARIETQLQLTITVVAERRGTVFLLLGMLAWVAAGFAGALVAAAAAGIFRIWFGAETLPEVSELGYVLIATAVFQGILLLAALRQGRLADDGDRCAGLGAGPIQRQSAVALLCAAMVVWLIGFMSVMQAVPALRDFAKSVTPDVLSDLGHGGAAAAVSQMLLVAIFAPLSEELFFRGWLWEGLRRRGQTVGTTACLTAIPWLLLHGLDAPGRILFLIPAALIFSVARHVGGSVRASLAVHVTNNGVAVLAQVISMLAEHGR
jgi:membrane protease YdiL (CAAX protease family)